MNRQQRSEYERIRQAAKRRAAGIPVRKKLVSAGTQWCPDCQEARPVSEFYPSTKSRPKSVRCIAHSIAYAKAWYAANKDRKRAYDVHHLAENRQKYRDANSRYMAAHPDRVNAKTQLRRAELAKRKPAWVEGPELAVFYESAVRVSKCLGIGHHVDHIVPLRGRSVSGLHVPANLRVLPAVANLVKSNQWQGVQ